jgi:flagellar basal-body rod protein FlgF
MDAITIAAASGLRSRMESLDILANNLANASTNGYKLDREFYGLYSSVEVQAGSPTPVLPTIERHWTDFAQGTLLPTGNSLDLSLSGRGFFTVDGPSGPLYTRNGRLHLSTQGRLVTAEGYPVRTVKGRPLVAQPSVPIDVASDGLVSQAGESLGQLQIVNFPDNSILTKQGNSYFRVGSPNVNPGKAEAEVVQGRIEASNVAVPEAAVRLVSVMRQFEILQKAMTLAGEMGRKTVEEVARVNQ